MCIAGNRGERLPIRCAFIGCAPPDVFTYTGEAVQSMTLSNVLVGFGQLCLPSVMVVAFLLILQALEFRHMRTLLLFCYFML